MWVEIGEKNSKSEILFLLQIFTDSLVLWICYFWSVDLCNNYHFLVSIFLFPLEKKHFKHNILKLIEIISFRVARYGVTFTYPLAKVLHFFCAVSPITLF